MIRRYTLFFTVILAFIGLSWLVNRFSHRADVATAKGQVIASQMMALSDNDFLLKNLALNDPIISDRLAHGRWDYLRTDPLTKTESKAYPLCVATECQRLTFYDYANGGTIEAIQASGFTEFFDVLIDTAARPHPSGYIIEKVVDIAAPHPEVKETLGDITKAEIAMIPMSTWLEDDACRDDWCVDLTFNNPEGDGRIFHIIVNLHTETVARTYFTRARDLRDGNIRSQVRDPYPEEADVLFTDACHEQYGWDVCWEMTADDGLDFYDATYDERTVFESVKIGQVEAYYPSWPGGYRDEIGYRASVPPKYDTRIDDLGDGFEVKQMFTEPFVWPTCTCCYRYEQIIRFNADGSFEPRFVSHGPGCDDLSEYRPMWRFDLGSQDNVLLVDQNQLAWTPLPKESELDVFRLGKADGRVAAYRKGLTQYQLEPIANDPLALDEARLFFVNEKSNEGEGIITAGAANNYQPARGFVNPDDDLSDDDLIMWYIPTLKTKQNDPWWCQPAPSPDFSPCESILKIYLDDALPDPSAQEIAEAQATPEPTATADPSVATAIPTRAPTPRAIAGVDATQIALNGGCTACHYFEEGVGEPGKVGPTLVNIGNVAAERVPGQSAEEYLVNSILYPNLYLAPNCPNGDCLANVMPQTYHLTMDESQINTVVDYMLSLKNVEEAQEIAASATETAGSSTTPSSNSSDSSSTLQSAVPLIGIVAGVLLLAIGLGIILSRRNKR